MFESVSRPAILAAVILIVMGVAHSYLGERYILIRLFKRDDLPKLFGGAAFTTGTLRFAWHLTTIAWWGLACLVYLAAGQTLDAAKTLRIIAVLALVSGIFPIVFTRARHLSWIVFFAIAALLFASSAVAANQPHVFSEYLE